MLDANCICLADARDVTQRGALMIADNATSLSEAAWLQNRIRELWQLRTSIIDEQAIAAIDQTIAEAEEKLQSLRCPAR